MNFLIEIYLILIFLRLQNIHQCKARSRLDALLWFSHKMSSVLWRVWISFLSLSAAAWNMGVDEENMKMIDIDNDNVRNIIEGGDHDKILELLRSNNCDQNVLLREKIFDKNSESVSVLYKILNNVVNGHSIILEILDKSIKTSEERNQRENVEISFDELTSEDDDKQMELIYDILRSRANNQRCSSAINSKNLFY